MLDVVASGDEWPIRVPPPLAVRRVAEAAGAPGLRATNATPTTRELQLEGSASTFSVPPVVLTVHSTAPMATGPAMTSPLTIPPADVLQFFGQEYATVVKYTPVPQFTRSSCGAAGGMGEVRQGSMVTLPRHTPQGPRPPPPGFPAATQVRDGRYRRWQAPRGANLLRCRRLRLLC